MAKKKEKEVLDEEENDFIAKILKKYGDGVVVNGNDITNDPPMVLPISPSLDTLLGGGVPEGSWLTFSSKSGVGKTTTALHFAANCQMDQWGGREVYYLDIEGRLKEKNIKGIKNLQLSKFHHIKSTKDKILSAQDFLTIGEDILKNTERAVVIIDSYSMLCHENELIGGIGTSTRGSGGYTLLSGFCRQMSQVVPVRKHVVVGIAQLMANPSGYGAAMTEKGGNSIMYQADIWLRAKAMERWEDGGKPIGQIVTWSTVKTALHGAIVGAEIQSYIRYGIGVDETQELIKSACDLGIIDTGKKGYYVCSFMEDHLDILGVKQWDEDAIKMCRFHGEHKMYNQIENNKQWKDILKKKVDDIYNGVTDEG